MKKYELQKQTYYDVLLYVKTLQKHKVLYLQPQHTQSGNVNG